MTSIHTIRKPHNGKGTRLNFGTPTPVFYQIVLVLSVAMGGAAFGLGAIRLFFASTAISYVLFIASVGGFKSSEAFAMGALSLIHI